VSRRWLLVGTLALAGAVAVSALLRVPPAPGGSGVAAAPADTVRVALDVREDAVHATRVAVDANQAVRLEATNHGLAPVRLGLSGYEDRVDSGPLAPGATWRGAFLADRPGEDFAWLVDGQPAGRFQVRGSHLEEGHR
jgi:hypothetical protein